MSPRLRGAVAVLLGNGPRSPALHMLALGALLFGLSEARGGSLFARRARLEIPAHRLEAVRRDFVADTARQPSAEEWRQLLRLQVDDELLFRYALTLGLHQNSAAQARLAQIAEFVDANPHETRPDDAADAGRARAALELGLHEGDLVVRRILIDSARRLIRSVVLLHRPTPEALRAHYTASAREYTRPPRLRLSQVAVNAFKWPDSRRRAQELHDRVGAGRLSFEQALALADATPAPVHLPLQTAQGLAAQFGNEFAEAVLALPPGAWSQPVPSRFGHHLVWVHERHEAELPSLEAVQAQVEQRLLERLADDWLRQRLDELRDEYEIVVPDQRP